MQKIKVLIIDQSISVCKMIKEIVTKHEYIELVGLSTEINEGVEFILSASPDIVLLDVNIPLKNGKTPLEMVLRTKLLPVIMLAENNVKQTAKTVQAMSNGAVDFIKKMEGLKGDDRANFEHCIITKIYDASKVKQVTSSLTTETSVAQIKASPAKSNIQQVMCRKSMEKHASLIVIGTSTGGPRALQRIIEDLPKNFSVPILIVQHMPATFTNSLATRLNSIGTIHIKEATDKEVIQNGTAYIAPGNYHMVVNESTNDYKIHLHQRNENSSHRPSVNVLFNSIAHLERLNKIAVVLTGMGKDGAEGVKKIKQLDHEAIVIAESNETTVIDGMPNAVIATNSVTEVIRLEEIANALVNYTK